MERFITVEVISKNIEEWENFSHILKDRILEAKGILIQEKKRKLYKKIRKERKKIDKYFDAPTDVGDKDWFEYLKNPFNWIEIDKFIFQDKKCSEESCQRIINEKDDISFYRAKGDDEYFLCEKCHNKQNKDVEIIWACREILES